jgi:hypothetical protein
MKHSSKQGGLIKVINGDYKNMAFAYSSSDCQFPALGDVVYFQIRNYKKNVLMAANITKDLTHPNVLDNNLMIPDASLKYVFHTLRTANSHMDGCNTADNAHTKYHILSQSTVAPVIPSYVAVNAKEINLYSPEVVKYMRNDVWDIVKNMPTSTQWYVDLETSDNRLIRDISLFHNH